MSDSRKLDNFKVFVENRQNKGVKPPNWSPFIRCDQTLFNFGKNGTQEALIPTANPPLFATHISHDAQNYHLSIGPEQNGTGPDAIKPGQPIPLNKLKPGEEIDITRWTIMANPQF